jgi:hypothetical protein
MTEREYINVRNLSDILTAQAALRKVITGNQPIIDEKEYRKVMVMLGKWELRLFRITKTTD